MEAAIVVNYNLGDCANEATTDTHFTYTLET